MKSILLYSITALIATAMVIFWSVHPDMTQKSGFPISTTIVLVGTILCGYMPLFGTIILGYLKKCNRN